MGRVNPVPNRKINDECAYDDLDEDTPEHKGVGEDPYFEDRFPFCPAGKDGPYLHDHDTKKRGGRCLNGQR